jgi:hypothetical protein
MVEIEELERNGFIRHECICDDCKTHPIFIKDEIEYVYSLKTKKIYRYERKCLIDL